MAQWEALLSLSLTHNPLTNIVYNVSAYSRLWVLKCVCENCQGRLAHVISSAGEAADENGCNALVFSACVVWKGPLLSLKEPHRPAGAINSRADNLIFSGESWLKSPLSLLISSPPCSLQNAVYCDKSPINVFLALEPPHSSNYTVTCV